jgi:hypothetical protein
VRGAPQLTLAIPRDGNNNHIADAWEESYALASIEQDADDDDYPVGDSHKGDSIALYDEYRGFHIGGTLVLVLLDVLSSPREGRHGYR